MPYAPTLAREGIHIDHYTAFPTRWQARSFFRLRTRFVLRTLPNRNSLLPSGLATRQFVSHEVVANSIQFELPSIDRIQVSRILSVSQCYAGGSGWKWEASLDEVRFNILCDEIVPTFGSGSKVGKIVADGVRISPPSHQERPAHRAFGSRHPFRNLDPGPHPKATVGRQDKDHKANSRAPMTSIKRILPARSKLLHNNHTQGAYSALMLAARITLPHFSVSSTMSLANSAVDSGRGVSPSSAIRSVILESASARLISWFSLLMISAGVLRGPRSQRNKPCAPSSPGPVMEKPLPTMRTPGCLALKIRPDSGKTTCYALGCTAAEI